MKIKAQKKKNINLLSSDVVTSSGGDNGHEGVIMTFVGLLVNSLCPLQLLMFPAQDHDTGIGGIK